MPLPKVKITIQEGLLGQVDAVDDSVSGLILFAPAASGLTLSTPKRYTNLKAAEADGINADFDTDNTVDAHAQIKAFFEEAGSGTELWVMLIAQTTTMETVCDKTNDLAKKLLNDAGGSVKMLAVTRVPDGAYSPSVTQGVDPDVFLAGAKMQALAEEFQTNHAPFRAIIGARGFDGTPANLKDAKTESNNRVQYVLSAEGTTGYPNVGRLLGRYASEPVQRKPSRVLSGDSNVTQGYFTDGATVETLESDWDSIHDDGYVFLRTFVGKSGYWWTGDPTAVAASNDFNSFARGRVMDKVDRIAYVVMVDNLDDDIELDSSGKLPEVVVKGYEQQIRSAIETQMTGEISAVVVEIDPDQNVLSTNKLTITRLAIQPRGYNGTIEINAGFTVTTS
jgi:hypothetical protein